MSENNLKSKLYASVLMVAYEVYDTKIVQLDDGTFKEEIIRKYNDEELK